MSLLLQGNFNLIVNGYSVFADFDKASHSVITLSAACNWNHVILSLNNIVKILSDSLLFSVGFDTNDITGSFAVKLKTASDHL